MLIGSGTKAPLADRTAWTTGRGAERRGDYSTLIPLSVGSRLARTDEWKPDGQIRTAASPAWLIPTEVQSDCQNGLFDSACLPGVRLVFGDAFYTSSSHVTSLSHTWSPPFLALHIFSHTWTPPSGLGLVGDFLQGLSYRLQIGGERFRATCAGSGCVSESQLGVGASIMPILASNPTRINSSLSISPYLIFGFGGWWTSLHQAQGAWDYGAGFQFHVFLEDLFVEGRLSNSTGNIVQSRTVALGYSLDHLFR